MINKEAKQLLQEMAVDATNFDTCGMCHKHFRDCEAEVMAVGDDYPEGSDIPVGRDFACAGARARKYLAKLNYKGETESFPRFMIAPLVFSAIAAIAAILIVIALLSR